MLVSKMMIVGKYGLILTLIIHYAGIIVFVLNGIPVGKQITTL